MRHLIVALIVAAKARSVQQDRGATAVEYALLAALIAGMIVLGVTALSINLVPLYQGVLDRLP